MTHARRFASVPSLLLALLTAWAGAAPGALAQEPAPTYTASLPLVTNKAPAGADTDLAYSAYTEIWWRYYWYHGAFYRDRMLGDLQSTQPVVPVWSPDGLRIAATLSIEDVGRDIYVLDTSGGVVPIASDADFTDGPAWSPDGRYLAFCERWGDSGAIAIVQPDGTLVRRLPTARQPDGLRWSPDGEWIAYLAVAYPEADLWMSRVDGSRSVLLRQGVNTQQVAPFWSPDGRWLAYIECPVTHYDGDLRLVSADGTHDLRLATDVDPLGGVSWAPDSRSLAYGLDGYTSGADLVRSPVEDATIGLSLTLVACAGRGPAWSPDGRFIAYGGAQLTVVLPDGSGKRTFGEGSTPAWSHSGRYLAYGVTLEDAGMTGGTSPAIYVLTVDGPNAPRLLAARAVNPAWRPTP